MNQLSYPSRIVDQRVEEYLSVFGAACIEESKWRYALSLFLPQQKTKSIPTIPPATSRIGSWRSSPLT